MRIEQKSYKGFKGALDGSEGIKMRYYSATLAVKSPNSSEPQMVTKFFKTFEDLLEVVEEVITRETDTILTVTSHVVSPEQYDKFWTVVLQDGQRS